MSEYAQQVGSLPAVESFREEPMVREELWREMQRLFSYKDVKRLAEQGLTRPAQLQLLAEHASIRPMEHYRLEDLP